MPTATIVPTPTPTFDDDHGDTAVFATIITFEESPTILSGELDALDDIDYFAIYNTEPGKLGSSLRRIFRLRPHQDDIRR